MEGVFWSCREVVTTLPGSRESKGFRSRKGLAFMSTTNLPEKWDLTQLGPLQAKAVTKALRDFDWRARSTVTKYDNVGDSLMTPLFGGTWPAKAVELMDVVKQTYGMAPTKANYADLVEELTAYTQAITEYLPVQDRRSTNPEVIAQRAEATRAREEREAKERAEAERLSKFIRHEYGLKETAAALKQVLGVLYPDVKFSVRSESYSMGCSITAGWTDGPTEREVHDICTVFQDETFDGMDDSRHSVKAAEWTDAAGRQHLFDFTGNHVRGTRSSSTAAVQGAAARFATETGDAAPDVFSQSGTLSAYARGGAPTRWHFHGPSDGEPYGILSQGEHATEDSSNVVNQMARCTSLATPTYPATSETVYRILVGEIGAPRTDTTAAPMREGVTVTINDAKAGVEIRFAAKPSTDVLERLKGAGWRWSRFSQCWYAKDSARARAFASQFAALPEVPMEDYGLRDYTDIDARMGA